MKKGRKIDVKRAEMKRWKLVNKGARVSKKKEKLGRKVTGCVEYAPVIYNRITASKD